MCDHILTFLLRTQDAAGPELILPASIEFRESGENFQILLLVHYFLFVFFPYDFYALFFLPYNLFTAEDSFLSAIINYTNSSTVHFKLSPTYVLYMACRHVLSSQHRPDVSPTERTHKVIAVVNKMVSMMEGVIQVSAARGLPTVELALGQRGQVLQHFWPATCLTVPRLLFSK